MSDLFGAPPAEPPTPAKRPRKPACHAGAAQNCRPAAELQVVQERQPEAPPAPAVPPAPIPLRQYGQVLLHDGRQVDSGSAEWKLECLASTLLQLGGAEREAWIAGYGTPEDQVALRLRMGAIKSAGRM